jgi:DNA-binding transcriptional LysR family regulator
MAVAEQLRTFVAVYRARSVTTGAAWRGLSQPAASQQLAGLERAAGGPLFVRTPQGVEPTARGVALYAETASALDQLEAVVASLEDQRPTAEAAVRLGSSAEFFTELALPVIGGDQAVVASFGGDSELLGRLERGELDVAVTNVVPGRRSLRAQAIGEKRFVLVAAPELVAGASFDSLPALGEWLSERPWVAYSVELPVTRRFFQTHLGRSFTARLQLAVPDLRAVAAAVERGMGCSLLPRFVCARALADGRMVEVHPVSALVPSEPWSVSVRVGDRARPAVGRFLDRVPSMTAAER